MYSVKGLFLHQHQIYFYNDTRSENSVPESRAYVYKIFIANILTIADVSNTTTIKCFKLILSSYLYIFVGSRRIGKRKQDTCKSHFYEISALTWLCCLLFAGIAILDLLTFHAEGLFLYWSQHAWQPMWCVWQQRDFKVPSPRIHFILKIILGLLNLPWQLVSCLAFYHQSKQQTPHTDTGSVLWYSCPFVAAPGADVASNYYW